MIYDGIAGSEGIAAGRAYIYNNDQVESMKEEYPPERQRQSFANWMRNKKKAKFRLRSLKRRCFQSLMRVRQ